jgi:hypothetical protein
MPVKMRNAKARQNRITPELVELWVRLNEIRDADADEEFEPRGRRNEYLDALSALNLALGIRPWQESPLYVDDPEPPDYRRRYQPDAEAWRRSWELRQALEAATGRG